MKKLFSLILIILILTSCTSDSTKMFVFDHNEDGTYSIYAFLDNIVSIVTIPKMYNKQTVTIISSGSFYRNTTIEKIIISDTIAEIEDYAFEGCTNLSSLHIGKEVKKVSGTSFVEANLSEITISPGNQYFIVINNCLIEKETGKLIIGTNNSVIPEGITEIAMHAFFGRLSLVSVKLPEGCKKIGYAAFARCSYLETVILPESLDNIDSGAFSFCSSLKNINIPSGITRIEEAVFHACHSMETIRIPDNVTEIGKEAFSLSTGPKDIYIPESVAVIEKDAFLTYCDNITIHCEAKEKPNGWADDWTSSNNIVIWGE